MRRKLYLSFGLTLLLLTVVLVLWHAPIGIIILLFAGIAIVTILDLTQKQKAIRRNFPLLGNMRYILEFFRPEIQQYFIASDTSERPFDRETRALVYRRAKSDLETLPFGTHRELYQSGTMWLQHSLKATNPHQIKSRRQIGGSECSQPYDSSLLNISAMSFGALSKNAIIALNTGAKLGNFAHNTGEGGLSPHHLLAGGDLIWQIGTGYFGARDDIGNFDVNLFSEKAKHPQVKMIEIKLSQGAKPGHGGILPKDKLTHEIAQIRHVPMGHDVLSPALHTAFDSPIGLCQFIKQLREASGGKPIGFKLCLGKRAEFLAIIKAMLFTKILPDFITIDGAEGGTGAAPIEFSNHVGAPLQTGLVYVHNALVGANLRDKITLIASGKVATGFDLIKLMALGADCCNAARSFMLALGCIQSLQCHSNQCPTGIATQNKRLMRGLAVSDKSQRVYRFHQATMHSMIDLLAAMGKHNATEVSAEDVYTRLYNNEVVNLAQAHPRIAPGSLLNQDIPAAFAHDWQKARAENF